MLRSSWPGIDVICQMSTQMPYVRCQRKSPILDFNAYAICQISTYMSYARSQCGCHVSRAMLWHPVSHVTLGHLRSHVTTTYNSTRYSYEGWFTASYTFDVRYAICHMTDSDTLSSPKPMCHINPKWWHPLRHATPWHYHVWCQNITFHRSAHRMTLDIMTP